MRMERQLLVVAALALGAVSVSARAQSCPVGAYTPGLTPLTDLGAGMYMGQQGGLYPGGSNVRPAGHEATGVTIATSQIVPRNAAGAPDPSGAIVFISIGMSNTRQAFDGFIAQAAADPDIDAHVALVNGAIGGMPAPRWAYPEIAGWTTWERLDESIASAGYAGAQVQVVWIKQSLMEGGSFPNMPNALRDALREIVRIARSRFPNLRLAYVSSRTYGGYAPPTGLNPEPIAYWGGFATKWLVAAQLSGDPALAYPAQAPWLSWGPYLWANGLGSDGIEGGVPGRSDGVEWHCNDFDGGGTHESAMGMEQAGRMLLDFFKTDPTARPWFVGDGASEPPDAGVVGGVDAGRPRDAGGVSSERDGGARGDASAVDGGGSRSYDALGASPLASASHGCAVVEGTAPRGPLSSMSTAALSICALLLRSRSLRSSRRRP